MAIDRTTLPNIWLHWETKKGNFYLDCATGQKYDHNPAVNFDWSSGNVLLKSGSNRRFAYTKYHEDTERLEFAEVAIDTTRGEHIHEWKYLSEPYFLGKDKSVVDKDGNPFVECCASNRYYCRNFTDFLSMLVRIDYYNNARELKKFLGSDTYTVGSGRAVEPRWTVYHAREWYKTKQRVRGTGKQQQLTDKLVAMEVTDSSNFNELYLNYTISLDTMYGYANGIIYFDRLVDGWSVLRFFRKTEMLNEHERIYLHDNGATRVVSMCQDGWIPSKASVSYGSYVFVNRETAIDQCKRLKYIMPIVEDAYNHRYQTALINALRFPELEQMMSLGYKDMADTIMRSSTPKADLKYYFGGYYNDKEKTILRKAGMTKQQLDLCLSNVRIPYHLALGDMRWMFGNDLSHLDYKTFEEFYDAFRRMPRNYHSSEPNYWVEEYGVDKRKFIKNLVRLGKKNPQIYTIARDTLNQYMNLNDPKPEIDWYFDSYSDAVRAHDAIDELKRAQDAERRAMWNAAEAERLAKQDKKRAKTDEERKCYEYEDDDYIIRLPKDSNEIISEGSFQRICIGGYTQRHANGDTNLFFIRRKSKPDIPFYAIEMRNDKCIQQIHGYGNKWLGNDPEAIPTVVRWLRKNGIVCDEKILTCKAHGYGSINEYVPMPVVD